MSTPPIETVPSKGLFGRILGVFFSPRETYAGVAARPKVLGALLVVLTVIAGVNYLFLATDIGQQAFVDQQLTQRQAYGADITPPIVESMNRMKPYAAPISAAAIVVFGPVVMLVITGVMMVVFNAFMGGDARFTQVFAVVVHSSLIGALQVLFVTPLNYARESMSSATSIGVLLPMIDGASFLGMFLGAIDLFQIWTLLSLSIGLGVLYKRRTAPIAWSLLAVVFVIVLIVTGIKAARSGA